MKYQIIIILPPSHIRGNREYLCILQDIKVILLIKMSDLQTRYPLVI